VDDALAILRARGVNCFRLRLFVAPDGEGVVTNDLAYSIALAKRAKASGARLLLDIHYSDTWADPAKQTKPAAWAGLAFPELVAAVKTYTTETLQAFVREGVAPDFVQLGNEITNGMLWPEGQVEFARRDDVAAWTRLGELLRAAHAGLDAAFPAGGRPRSILHVENPDQLDRVLWFCREATAARVPFDLIGVSYYPEWHGGLPELRQALTELARTFRKPVLVVETAYPWKKDEHWVGRPNMKWPLTPAGQRCFVADVAAAVCATPDGLGIGVVYWHPESVPVRDLAVWVGGSCALFGKNGRVLPAAAELAGPR
jgi:arabinogalactan endo-1,4-beta-galactosidase